MTERKSVVNLFQNKTIVFKARMAAILGCSFNFQWYPLDKQVCDLKLESCMYHKLHINFHRISSVDIEH
jgi:hypothetical protein